MLFNLLASSSTAKNESREHHLQLHMHPRRKNLLRHPGRRVCANVRLCVCVRGSDGSRAAAGHRSPETFISHYTERRRAGWRGWRRGREGGEEETWRTDQKDREEGRQRGKQRRRENSRGCLEVRKRRPRRRVRRPSLPRGLRADVGSDFGRGVYWDAPTLTSCVCACACVRVCVHTPVSRCTNTTIL